MADNAQKYDNAEYTFCFERQSMPDGRTAVHALPWVFVKFDSAGESRDYVMPIPPQVNIMGSGIHSVLNDISFGTETDRPLFYRFGRAFIEYMPNKPFPLSADTSSGNQAIHYFGNI